MSAASSVGSPVGSPVAASVTVGSGGGAGPGFDVYVDSVNGSDSNPGTENAPLQTLAAAMTALDTDGMSLGLARGSYWRERFNVPINDLSIGVYGSGAAPIIDGADVITGTWTQPDAVTNPNVWSISFTRTSATTTASEVLGYWENGVRPRYGSSDADLQANGGWRSSGLTLQTSTITIRADGNPNSDGIVREATRRHYAINGHPNTVGSTKTGQAFAGPIELTRCVGHYNALTLGPGLASSFLLREGNIHHSVSEGNQTDIIATEFSPNVGPSVWAFYRAASSGFNPIATRCFALLPGGANRRENASAFYAHGGTGAIESLTLNGCIGKGCDFANADASQLTVNGGYCEDQYVRAVTLGAANNTINHMLINETTASPWTSSNTGFLIGSSTASQAELNHVAVHLIKSATGFRQDNTTHQPELTNCAFVTAGSPVFGGKPIMNYCVLYGAARTMDQIITGYTGDYNVFYFTLLTNPQFLFNGVVRGDLATWQSATGQDANSVFLKPADQVSGNGIAFWLGLANGENLGPKDGDWRINPSARVYNGAGTQLSGVFADGTTPITAAGPQQYWNFNTRSATSGVWQVPTLPATISEMRTYIEDPTAWDFYP